MSATCPHGFTPNECLICQTLGTQPQVQVETKRSRVKDQRRLPIVQPVPGQPPARPDAVYPPRKPRQPRSPGTHIAVIAVGLVAIGAVAWIVAGVVFALLHVLELVVIAALAGWAGYRLGHYRGRRQPRP